MLLEFGLKNFCSFKEGAAISFKLTPSCPIHISKGENYSPILGIKGKNSSGKTNILKGLAFVASFCTNSFKDKPDQPIMVRSFYENNKDSEFYIEFSIKNISYIYELVINSKKVVRETLFRKEARKTKIIERIENTFVEVISEFDALHQIKLRTNASFISTFNQYDLDGLDALQSIYNFFNLVISNVYWGGLSMAHPNVGVVSEYLYSNEETFAFVKQIIKSCDTGVEDITIIKKDDEETQETKYFPIFFHKVEGENKPISFMSESSGTQSLFLQLAKYKLVILCGGVLCLDEFDITFHPHILPLLLDLFEDKEHNPLNAQFIFTTHNTEILDYLTKYRTYIVEKENNESFAYRLDEIPGDLIRNDRSIVPIYNSGKIGGVPHLT